jgi:hypothetical protein
MRRCSTRTSRRFPQCPVETGAAQYWSALARHEGNNRGGTALRAANVGFDARPHIPQIGSAFLTKLGFMLELHCAKEHLLAGTEDEFLSARNASQGFVSEFHARLRHLRDCEFCGSTDVVLERIPTCATRESGKPTPGLPIPSVGRGKTIDTVKTASGATSTGGNCAHFTRASHSSDFRPFQISWASVMA